MRVAIACRSASVSCEPGVKRAAAISSAGVKAWVPDRRNSLTITRTDSEPGAAGPVVSAMRVAGAAGAGGAGGGGSCCSCEPAPGSCWASTPWLRDNRTSGNNLIFTVNPLCETDHRLTLPVSDRRTGSVCQGNQATGSGRTAKPAELRYGDRRCGELASTPHDVLLLDQR